MHTPPAEKAVDFVEVEIHDGGSVRSSSLVRIEAELTASGNPWRAMGFGHLWGSGQAVMLMRVRWWMCGFRWSTCPRHLDELQGDGPLLATMTFDELHLAMQGASRSARTKAAGGETEHHLSSPLI